MPCYDIHPNFAYRVFELKCGCTLYLPYLYVAALHFLEKVKMVLKEVQATSSVSSGRYTLCWDGLVLSGHQYDVNELLKIT